MTRKVVSPIALDKSFNTTEQTPRNIADVLAQQLAAIKTAIESGNGNLEAAFVCYYGVTTATQIREAIEDGKVPYFYYNGVVAQLWKVETDKYTFRTTNTRSVEGQTILDVVDYVVNGSVWSTVTREVLGGSSSGQSYIASVNSLADFDTTGKSGMQDLVSVANVPADGVYQVSVMLHITPKNASATKSDLVLQFTSSDNTGWPSHTFHAVVDDSQTFAQQLSFSTSVSLKAGENTLRIQCGGLNTEYLVFVDELTVAQLVNGVYHNGDDFADVHTLTEAADFNNDDGVLVDGATGGPRFMLWQTLANKILGFIKSLSTTITSFRTGDVIPVDGPSGTAKIGKDDLLQVTAENALSDVHCDFVDITWTDGKYINLANGLSTNGGYSYSDTIQVADGKQLSFKARGYLNYTSIIAEYESDSDLYITLTQSVGSAGHESDLLTYTWKNKTGETKNIRLSCMITDRPSKVCITPILDDYEVSRKINTTRIIGKYISSVGTEASSSGWAHSSVITLGAGERVSFDGAGYLGNVSMISEYSNGTYTSLVASVDDNVRTYEYTNNTSTSKTIVLSFDDNSSKRPKGFYVYSNTLNRALEFEETATNGIDNRLSSLESFLDLGLEQKTFTTSSGFITIAGTIGSNSGYRYTSSVVVPIGYTVEIVARGYATNVAMIAREIVAGSSYTYLVPSVDDSLRRYSWTNTGDSSENIAFSFSVTDAPTFVTLFKENDTDKIHLTMSFFESFGALGDSFTAGNLYKGGTSVGTFNHKYSWVSDLSKIIGVEGTNYGVGGATTKSAVTHPDQLPKILSDDPLELYIVNFGINEVWNMGSSYIGTSADIDSDDPDQSADSFYGNYYRIIKNIQAHAPKAVVVMMFPTTISNTSALKALWNSYYIAAQDIASICGIKFFDTNELLEYSSYTSMQGGHPTITGYATMAIVYKELIERWLQHKDPISLLG